MTAASSLRRAGDALAPMIAVAVTVSLYATISSLLAGGIPSRCAAAFVKNDWASARPN